MHAIILRAIGIVFLLLISTPVWAESNEAEREERHRRMEYLRNLSTQNYQVALESIKSMEAHGDNFALYELGRLQISGPAELLDIESSKHSLKKALATTFQQFAAFYLSCEDIFSQRKDYVASLAGEPDSPLMKDYLLNDYWGILMSLTYYGPLGTQIPYDVIDEWLSCIGRFGTPRQKVKLFADGVPDETARKVLQELIEKSSAK